MHKRKAYLPIIKNSRNTNIFRHTITKLLFLCLLTLVYLVCSKHAPVSFSHFLLMEVPLHQLKIQNSTKGDQPLEVIKEEQDKRSIPDDDDDYKNDFKTSKTIPKKCNIFEGKWVRDKSLPYYEAGSCPYIDPKFDCYGNGRLDVEYMQWRWKPKDCDIPRMNGIDFLERMRGKRMILVGDSMNRSMLQSLACILRQSLGNWSRVHEVRRNTEFKAVGYNSLFFEDYEFYLDFFQTPFLVERVYNGSIEVNLRLDVVDEGTSAIRKSDYVIFNTGHWFTDQKTYGGKNYYQEGNYVHPQLDHMEAYTKALKTWAKWIDHTFSHGKTKVFFQALSPTHFRGGQWNSGGKCHTETEPIFNETFLEEYPVHNRIFEQVREGMETPVVYLNITRLTDYRKDGHVSMYYLDRRTSEEKVMAVKLQDCSHWCMPGVPDTWNELLYASLVMDGQD